MALFSWRLHATQRSKQSMANHGCVITGHPGDLLDHRSAHATIVWREHLLDKFGADRQLELRTCKQRQRARIVDDGAIGAQPQSGAHPLVKEHRKEHPLHWLGPAINNEGKLCATIAYERKRECV